MKSRGILSIILFLSVLAPLCATDALDRAIDYDENEDEGGGYIPWSPKPLPPKQLPQSQGVDPNHATPTTGQYAGGGTANPGEYSPAHWEFANGAGNRGGGMDSGTGSLANGWDGGPGGSQGGGSPSGGGGSPSGGGAPSGGGSPIAGGPSNSGEPLPDIENLTVDISQESLKHLVRWEGVPTKPVWPGGASGVTIGAGYDLGHKSADQIRADLAPFVEAGLISQEDVERLAAMAGITGEAAGAALASVADIHIPKEMSMQLLSETLLPRYNGYAQNVFGSYDSVNADQRGAMTELCYWLGPGRDWYGELDSVIAANPDNPTAVRDWLYARADHQFPLNGTNLNLACNTRLKEIGELWMGNYENIRQ